ncbi:MAG: HAMP domain-containing sensor histidine kinase [Bacteroidales bacterium]|nr:HAMP domain-containing sensor histidine kinase [Bacteroidales bacterium]
MKDKTFFAPAKRDLKEVVFTDYQDIANNEYLTGMMNALPEIAAILNEHRQIVFGNESLIGFLNILDKDDVLGLRPGEALGCVNSKLNDGGCGTSEKCRYCGAVNAILESQTEQKRVEKECRITTNIDDNIEQLDLKVTATPFIYRKKIYTIVALEDISDAKRRQVLERIFFHDILNIAGSLKGFADVIKSTKQKESKVEKSDIEDYIDIMGKLSNELLEEILSQRTLLSAESGDLKVTLSPISSKMVIEQAISYLSVSGFSEGKRMIIDKDSVDVIFNTDTTILKRVIINMLKNALEASFEDQDVTLKVVNNKDYAIFSIRNVSVMSNEVKAQIFQRSFSTKGNDRGIGTYSIKLLTERYLQGEVEFESEIDKGTTFTVYIPLR